MKNLVFVFVMILAQAGVVAQPGRSAAQALDSLRVKMNAEHFGEIHGMLGGGLKTALSPEACSKFFLAINKDLGKWEKSDFKDKTINGEIWLATFERGELNISLHVTDGLIDYLYLEPAEPKPAEVVRNITPMKIPFDGQWYVFWGGDTKEQNYHVVSRQQRHAFDLVIMNEKGRTCNKPCKTNEDYLAFGQNILSTCDAVVDAVLDGVDDNIPGVMNAEQVAGNYVVLKTGSNEYVVFAHFRKGSVKVKPGDRVKAGDLLGQCGNSGNSSEAHLHLHIQDKPWGDQTATGIKCFFESVTVEKGGKTEVKKDYSPVQADRIQP